MASRTRTRESTGNWKLWHTSSPEPPGSTFSQSDEVFSDDNRGPCACAHYKYQKVTFTYDGINSEAGVRGKYTDTVIALNPDLQFSHLELDWEKLPTSSGFGILQILAEIDDTIAMFTARFWRQLSYGSLTWGVLPFVSDIKALLRTIARLGDSLSSIPYEDSFEVTVSARDPVTSYGSLIWWAPEQKFKARLCGFADISFHHEASRLLDRIGFHPDLATAWDLVPLSFLVDYLLPIGDFLESLRQGGWVKTAYFSGWFSVKGKYNWNFGAYQSPLYVGSTSGTTQFYIRRPWSGVLVAPGPSVPDLDLPSPRELFNILYVLRSR